MEQILAGWDERERGGRRKPHVLYTVPSGQNPTGATQSVERRRAIYEVARRHDVLVVEDEPYYYLQMQEPGTEAPGSVEEFLEGLVPTYLSMDVDGRVVRMDSFSKVVVPGSRMGWITASEQLVERFIRHAEVANQGPNGFSQVILHKLLDERWGHEGYLRWLMNLRMEYTKRRDIMAAACDEFLPREVVSWKPPQAGMFVSFLGYPFLDGADRCQQWLKVNHELHPQASTKGILDIEEEIFNSCISKGVLVARGSWFRAEQNIPPSGLYFRATFAAATPENMREAIRRLGEAIRESYQL
jgi:aromatic amino acid aminotransferase I